MNENINLSVIIPVYNEQDNLENIYQQTVGALQGRYSFEIIFIDDGSSDNGCKVLEQIYNKDNRVKVIMFRRNFGQTAAMSAGFHNAKGDVIIPLDADGQNDPADIPALMDKLNEGYDIVSGWRKDRKDKTITRKIPSMIANKLICKMTGVNLHDFGCSLKAYRREVMETTKLYGEMHRFIPAIANWSGARITEMVVNHHPRTAGKAKYGLERIVKVVLDLMTVKFLGSYATKPIYIFGGLGIFSGIASFICGLVVLYMKFISAGHLGMNRNPLLLLSAILFIAFFQLILMGLLAEMIVRTYHESQNRPTYTVRKFLQRGTTDEAKA
ncbi:MAG: glycosyltransferase family 2 protein [Phycisphaerae bacterium]|jgi:glycosyltransferase involved in cell wall biosynthesis